tara:strand:+ start:201 stop:1037 length:837 start_codon:yes stop_codon:yes gene_type:complete
MINFPKGLYIVSTPIGNLEDISIRAIDVLKKSDIILCEDTRHTIKLLNHFNINKTLLPYHKFNERKQLKKIIKYLNEGKILSLVSDAGTPALSDPGSLLIKECIQKKIEIYPIPGASAITSAMSISGFDHQFIFYGFLPKKEKEVEKILSELKNLKFSIVFFVTAKRINFYLKLFKTFFKQREILIAKEISKLYETFYRGKIEEIKMFTSPLKGELTVVISKNNNKFDTISTNEIKKLATEYLKKYSIKDVVELIIKKEKISKKKVYQICLDLKKSIK